MLCCWVAPPLPLLPQFRAWLPRLLLQLQLLQLSGGRVAWLLLPHPAHAPGRRSPHLPATPHTASLALPSTILPPPPCLLAAQGAGVGRGGGVPLPALRGSSGPPLCTRHHPLRRPHPHPHHPHPLPAQRPAAAVLLLGRHPRGQRRPAGGGGRGAAGVGVGRAGGRPRRARRPAGPRAPQRRTACVGGVRQRRSAVAG